MKAYSQDLRERVLRAVDLGRPRAEIVQLYRMGVQREKTTTRIMTRQQEQC